MYSYEDRIRAVELYIKRGKRVRPTSGEKTPALIVMHGGVEQRPLFDDDTVLVYRTGHPLTMQRVVTWADVAPFP
ncbi:hypothetical protein [Variovorax gossypii]